MGNENTSIVSEEKLYIICNQMKSRGDTKRWGFVKLQEQIFFSLPSDSTKTSSTLVVH